MADTCFLSFVKLIHLGEFGMGSAADYYSIYMLLVERKAEALLL